MRAVILSLCLLVVVPAARAVDFDTAAAAYRQNDYGTALNAFTELSDQGDPRARTVLALMYKYGEGTAKDLAKSYELYKAAAEQGYAPAQYQTGIMLADGLGTSRDREAAVEWLTRSAQAGFSRANDKLSALNVARVDNDPDKLVAWSNDWDFNLPADLRVTPGKAPAIVDNVTSYRAQLGAMSTRDNAIALWEQLANQAPGLLQDVSYIIKEANYGSRILYRVQAGPFESYENVARFCQRLSQRIGSGCLPLLSR